MRTAPLVCRVHQLVGLEVGPHQLGQLRTGHLLLQPVRGGNDRTAKVALKFEIKFDDGAPSMIMPLAQACIWLTLPKNSFSSLLISSEALKPFFLEPASSTTHGASAWLHGHTGLHADKKHFNASNGFRCFKHMASWDIRTQSRPSTCAVLPLAVKTKKTTCLLTEKVNDIRCTQFYGVVC